MPVRCDKQAVRGLPPLTAGKGRTAGPNRLLWGLLLFSMAAHGALFLHLSGIFRIEVLSAIELTVKERKWAMRDIPRPRPRFKPPPSVPQPDKQPLHRRQPLQLKPLMIDPVDLNVPDSLMETIPTPENPQLSAPQVAVWEGGALGGEESFGSVRDYFDMVRLRIESKKKYPAAARVRQIEGRVTVRFVIGADGTVKTAAVSKSSRNGELDAAALKAIRASSPFPRPPSHLFSGDLSLEVMILFELT